MVSPGIPEISIQCGVSTLWPEKRTAQITAEEVATALADLAERPAVPLRVPVGAVAEKILAARDAAPHDRPFVRG